MESKLYYLNEAKDWNEALPLGNGTMGCMFFGGVTKEVLQINQESIWAGPPHPENSVGSHKYLDKATQLLKKGRYLEAQKLVQNRVMDKRISPRSYQPLCNLIFSFKSMKGFIQYKRELDLGRSIGSTFWSKDGIDYLRETFIPVKENCIISKISASESKSINMEIYVEREGIFKPSYTNGKILISGQADHNGTHKGVKFTSTVSIELNGGKLVTQNNSINIIDANSVVVVVTSNTDYNFKNPLSPYKRYDSHKVVVGKHFETIKQNHINEYSSLYGKMSLVLGNRYSYDAEPTNIRLKNYKDNRSLSFLTLYFNYARYLTISSSRENSLCANLQGVWCKDIEAPWNSDYHLNVNIQMIYWLCEAVGLGELHKPFFDYCEALIPNGRQTAKQVYNCRGVVNHHCSDLWLFTAPFGEVEYGMWPLAAGWNSRHFMEHFDYTGDRKFLTDRALPYLKEASLFFLDYLVEDGHGKLIFGPSSSPENMFYDPETSEICNITLGSTMAQQIVWETFSNYLRALSILNIYDDSIEEVKSALARLKETVIGSDGRIMEWDREFIEVDPGHRHISHLYAIYPGFQFQNDAKYLKAAELTLIKRLESGGGHTGWSRAWIINLWARLKDSQKVWENINALIERSTLSNLLDNHPPFQLDGNMGGASGILEMIVQSNMGSVWLLPAIPESIKDGSVKGLRVRGGFILDFSWVNYYVVKLTITSLLGNHITVYLPDESIIFDGETIQSQVIELLN